MERLGQVWRASWGITRDFHKSAEDFHKEALDYEKQGDLNKAQACYLQALRATEKLNSTESKVCRTLARIHLDYALLLEKQRNVIEAGNAYQQAQIYGLDAYRLESDQAEVQVLLQNIGLCRSQYLLSQRQSAESEKVLQETVQLVKEKAAEHKASPDGFLLPTNNLAAAAHRPNFSSNSPPFSIQAANTGGRIVVQNCQGTINAPVHGKNNTVTVHYYPPNLEAKRPNAVSLDNLRSALYQHYKLSNLSIQRVSGETASLKDCYINLAIVESQAQREKDKKELEKQAVIFERLPSSERLEATNPNKLMALEKLFARQKLRDGSEGIPKRILIQGRAGIGKTTLCKKLVYEYHENGLWQNQFESMLWIPLRQLKTYVPKRLEDLLCKQYFVDHASSRAQALSKVLHEHQGKTLFVLDGLDEVASELGGENQLGTFLRALLEKKYVVITSRPTGVDANKLSKLDLELETIGFSQDNVQAYIQKFAPETQQAAIQQFIKETPLMQGLVNIPIQLDALCYSWANLPKHQTVTMANLYEAMVHKLWLKDSKRLKKRDSEEELTEHKLKKRMAPEVHYLSYLAFKGLETGKIEFSWHDLSECEEELDEILGLEIDAYTLKKTSILHTINLEEPDEKKRHYHFLHLTFQEFFAAKFLVKHLQAYTNIERPAVNAYGVQKGLGVVSKRHEVEAFIATHKYNPRYEIVWWMVTGLLKGAPLEHFFTLLGQAPHDLIGGRHQQVLMGCLSEARSQLKPETVDKLEKELTQWFGFEMKLSNGGSKLALQRGFPEHLLLKSLDQFDGKKQQIIQILGMRHTLSESAEQALIGALQDQNEDIKYAAASVLGGQSTFFEAAMQPLLSLIGEGKNGPVSYATANALRDKSTFDMLAWMNAVHAQFKDITSVAACGLGGQSMLSKAAEQALTGALQDQNENIRSVAARALEVQSMLPEAAEQALTSVVQDQNGATMSAADYTLDDDGESSILEIALCGMTQSLITNILNTMAMSASALGPEAVLTSANALELEALFKSASAFKNQITFPEAIVLGLIGALQDEEENGRLAAVNALESQSTLSEAGVQALIGALEHENFGTRSAAAHILGCQSTLSGATVHALIGALWDPNESVRSAAVRTLGMHIDFIYSILPSLLSNQIKILYTELLFKYSCKYMAVLYVQDQQLHFYTATGPGQPIDLTTEQSAVIIKALRSVRAEAGIAPFPEEEPFLIEE